MPTTTSRAAESLDRRFLSAMADERVRLASRRAFLRAGAGATGAAALALAAGSGLGLRGALAQDGDFADDLEVANYALTLEHLEFAFYRDGLATLAEDDLADGVFAELEAIRDHERAHVDALVATISDAGGTPVEEREYDFGYEDVEGFLATAQALENTGVAAYAGAAPSITDPAILAAALAIHSVEARHAAYLNLQNETSAFPTAFDEALSPDEVLEIAGPFIVGEDATPAAGTPAASTGAAVEIDGFAFRPKSLEVTAGTTVTWTNREVVPHTATAEDGSFDSEALGENDSFSYTFDEPGTYPYLCTFHTNMRGEVVVS
jgi:plastocyanin